MKSELLDKLLPRRVRAIHLVYYSSRRGNFVYILELQRITMVSDVAFDEKNFTVLGTLRPETRLLRRAHNTELPTSATPARALTASELPPGMDILDTIHNPAAPIDDSSKASLHCRRDRHACLLQLRPTINGICTAHEV